MCLIIAAGRTLAENLAECPDLAEAQQVIVPLEEPIKSSGHIQILYGNLAPEVRAAGSLPTCLLSQSTISMLPTVDVEL